MALITPGFCALQAVGEAPSRPDAQLTFLFVVAGPAADRANGLASSWVAPDAAFRSRRDALARCVVASLCARQGRAVDETAI